ncbi:hypothetical protein H9L39_08661 [Fusarium oxysporum f. sp. albedinis]|nr:hypothetical protein H9L39_08661 [Fusarium oxysporum f. sp. albedinis]
MRDTIKNDALSQQLQSRDVGDEMSVCNSPSSLKFLRNDARRMNVYVNTTEPISELRSEATIRCRLEF